MTGVSQEHILSISFNYTWKVQCTEHTCMLYVIYTESFRFEDSYYMCTLPRENKVNLKISVEI